MPLRFLSCVAISFAALSVLSTNSSQAQERAARQSLTIDSIFHEHQFAAKGVSGQWQSDSQGFERIDRLPNTKGTSIVSKPLMDPSSETVLVPSDWLLPEGGEEPITIENFEWSADRTKLLIFTNSKRVWRLNTRGDYWVLDLSTKKLMKLGGDAPESTMMFAKFTPDGLSVAYVQANDLYIQTIDSQCAGEIKRLTHSDRATSIYGTFDWVYEEEFSLRDGFRISPDGKRVAFWHVDSSGIELFPLVDNTSTLYPKIQWIAYPKVGTTNPAARIGVMELATQQTTWMNIPGDSRDNYLPRMDWIDSDRLAIQQLNRLQNQLQMYVADAGAGEARVALTERDAAWVDVRDEMHWLDDKARFLWLSEREGWQHIYLASIDGSPLKQLTRGDFDVMDIVGVDEPKGLIYFYASPNNATQRYLYRVGVDGSNLCKVTPADSTGSHRYVLSPDRSRALLVASRYGAPPVTSVVRLSDHATEFVLEDNSELRDKLAQVQLPQREFMRVDIGHGIELDAWRLVPSDFDPTKKYPLVIHVYGEPAGQTVQDQWGGDQALWHQMLAEQGYIVMSFDNRGTPGPRGRAWRKSIYRQIGVLASSDQALALRSVLKSHPFIDASRVGIWGWSGGGSMTLNALLRYPELYQAGVSVAPVPNQLYYDTIYQERYMGLPSDNAEGYRLGSPITFADKLQGDLLLIHGTGDDNCHYQTMELLINELIKNNKQFSMLAYPNRTHAIREGENTTRHLYEAITSHFKKAIPVNRNP